MDLNSIDASIGLVFSLELFKAYKASGTLQARLKSIPGMPKTVSYHYSLWMAL